MAIHATAGTRFFIGGARSSRNGDLVKNDFAGETWTEVTSLQSLGSMGMASQTTEIATLESRRVPLLKGRQAGSTMQILCASEQADIGQEKLLEAFRGAHFAFRILLVDAAQRLFVGQVLSFEDVFNDAGSAIGIGFAIYIESNIVRVSQYGV